MNACVLKRRNRREGGAGKFILLGERGSGTSHLLILHRPRNIICHCSPRDGIGSARGDTHLDRVASTLQPPSGRELHQRLAVYAASVIEPSVNEYLPLIGVEKYGFFDVLHNACSGLPHQHVLIKQPRGRRELVSDHSSTRVGHTESKPQETLEAACRKARKQVSRCTCGIERC